MADQPSESQNNSPAVKSALLLKAEAAIANRKSREAEARKLAANIDQTALDQTNLGRPHLGALDLGEGPFDHGPALTPDALAQLQHAANVQEAEEAVAELDSLTPAPVSGKGLTLQDQMANWKENQTKPKPKTGKVWRPSPKQIEIAAYRRGEGREAWNEYQKAKRWIKADSEGREIRARENLTDMTPEQKAAHKREQAAARKRKQRAKNT